MVAPTPNEEAEFELRSALSHHRGLRTPRSWEPGSGQTRLSAVVSRVNHSTSFSRSGTGIKLPGVRSVHAIVSAVMVGLLAGCTAAPAPTSAPAVDPQVLQDVIEASFMVPGDGVRRAMRVREFNRQAGIRKCGGHPTRSLDTTANRWDQALFADLELIREYGLGEGLSADTKADDEALAKIRPGCDLFPPIHDFDKWFALQGAWNDVVLTTVQNPVMVSLKKPMASCLADRTGLKVTADDPANSYLKAVTERWLKLSKADWEAQWQGYTYAFIDCGQEYYDTLTKLLLPEREKMVEQNREALTQFAIHIVEAGYVP